MQRWITKRDCDTAASLIVALQNMTEIARVASIAHGEDGVFSDELYVSSAPSANNRVELHLYENTLTDGSHTYDVKLFG